MPCVPRCSDGSGCSALATKRNRCMRPTKNINSSCRESVSPRHTRFPTLNGIKHCIRRASASRSSLLNTAVGKLASGLKWSGSGHTFGSCIIPYRLPNTIVSTGRSKPPIVTGLTTVWGIIENIAAKRSTSLSTDSVYGICALSAELGSRSLTT